MANRGGLAPEMVRFWLDMDENSGAIAAPHAAIHFIKHLIDDYSFA